MDRLKAMQLFRAVHETGSFALAAERENFSAPAVSRQIANLETHLGARLFHRTTRRLSLTESGLIYLSRVEAILDAVEEAESEAGQQHVNPQGLLRVSAPLSYSLATLSPVLAAFTETYPDLTLDIDVSDRTVDLVHEGFDVALRISAEPAPNLIARKLGDIHMVACASPDYLATQAVLTHPSELSRHPVLLYSNFGQRYAYLFRRGDEDVEVMLDGRILANNGDLLRELAIAHRGVTIQPDFVLADALTAGKLVRVLPDWTGECFGIYAVYASRRHLPAKIRVFIDYLVNAMSATQNARG